MNFWAKALFNLVNPGILGVIGLAAAAATLLVGVVTAIFSSPSDGAMSLGMCFATCVAPILVVTAILTRGRGATAAMLFLAAGSCGAGGVAASAAVGLKGDNPLGGVIICGPPGAVLAVLALGVAAWAIRSVAGDVFQMRKDAAKETMLAQHGRLSVDDGKAATGLSHAQTIDLMSRWAASKRLGGRFDRANGTYYSKRWLDDHLSQFRGMVQARGSVSFRDAATELRLTPKDVEQLTYEAIDAGADLSCDWDNGVVLAGQAVSYTVETPCPACGGILAPAGHGKLKCQHCGGEV